MRTIINIFENQEFWNKLAIYNQDIINAWHKMVPIDGDGDVTTRDEKILRMPANEWFNPRLTKKIPFAKYYPELVELNNDPKFVLPENRPNYVSLWAINKLYGDRKDVLIEDICCGMGKFIFFLSKLGFTNFSLVDDFSQISEAMLTDMLNGIPYVLNQDTQPVIINYVGYPHLVKEFNFTKLELFCVYNHPTFLHESEAYIKKHQFEKLFEDSDEFMSVWARADKYAEFLKKIKN